MLDEMKQGDRLATLLVLVCVYNNLLFGIELMFQTQFTASVHNSLFDDDFAHGCAGIGCDSDHIGSGAEIVSRNGDVVVTVCFVENFLTCQIEDFYCPDLVGSDVDVVGGRIRGEGDFNLVVVVDADIDESDVDVYFNFWMFEIIGIDVQCTGSIAEHVVAGEADGDVLMVSGNNVAGGQRRSDPAGDGRAVNDDFDVPIIRKIRVALGKSVPGRTALRPVAVIVGLVGVVAAYAAAIYGLVDPNRSPDVSAVNDDRGVEVDVVPAVGGDERLFVNHLARAFGDHSSHFVDSECGSGDGGVAESDLHLVDGPAYVVDEVLGRHADGCFPLCAIGEADAGVFIQVVRESGSTSGSVVWCSDVVGGHDAEGEGGVTGVIDAETVVAGCGVVEVGQKDVLVRSHCYAWSSSCGQFGDGEVVNIVGAGGVVRSAGIEVDGTQLVDAAGGAALLVAEWPDCHNDIIDDEFRGIQIEINVVLDVEPGVGREGEVVFKAAYGKVATAVVVKIAFEGPLGAGSIVMLDIEIGTAATGWNVVVVLDFVVA